MENINIGLLRNSFGIWVDHSNIYDEENLFNKNEYPPPVLDTEIQLFLIKSGKHLLPFPLPDPSRPLYI